MCSYSPRIDNIHHGTRPDPKRGRRPHAPHPAMWIEPSSVYGNVRGGAKMEAAHTGVPWPSHGPSAGSYARIIKFAQTGLVFTARSALPRLIELMLVLRPSWSETPTGFDLNWSGPLDDEGRTAHDIPGSQGERTGPIPGQYLGADGGHDRPHRRQSARQNFGGPWTNLTAGGLLPLPPPPPQGAFAEIIFANSKWLVVQNQQGQQFPIAANAIGQFLISLARRLERPITRRTCRGHRRRPGKHDSSDQPH